MNLNLFRSITTVLSILVPLHVPAIDIEVPDDYPTLLEAVNASAPGDVIIITELVENVPLITLNGKSLTFRGAAHVAYDFNIQSSEIEFQGDIHGELTAVDSTVRLIDYGGDFGLYLTNVDFEMKNSYTLGAREHRFQGSRFIIENASFRILPNPNPPNNESFFIKNSYVIYARADSVVAENSNVSNIDGSVVQLANVETRYIRATESIDANFCIASVIDAPSVTLNQVYSPSERQLMISNNSIEPGLLKMQGCAAHGFTVSDFASVEVDSCLALEVVSPGERCRLDVSIGRCIESDAEQFHGFDFSNCQDVLVTNSLVEGGESGPATGSCEFFLTSCEGTVPGIPGAGIHAVDSNIVLQDTYLIPGPDSDPWPSGDYISGSGISGSIRDEVPMMLLDDWPASLGADRNEDSILDIADIASLNPDTLQGLLVNY